VPSDARVRRTGSPPARRAALTRRRSGRTGSLGWLGGLPLVVIAALACSPATSGVSATPAAPKSTFSQGLSLAVSFGSAVAAGAPSVTANFTLTNNGSSPYNGCFGPSWGVSVITEDGHDAGHIVRSDHPGCVERFTLSPRQKIVWSKKVPLDDLRAGMAKVTGWVKVVDPAACNPGSVCHEVSVASPLMTLPIVPR
jgi:hypothetical protein